MATGIPDKERRVEACKKETLEDAVEYLLEEYDLKGANPYTMQGGKYTLAQLVGWLSGHKQMKNKSMRRRNDILRVELNEMMSIVRVGSTRKAMYAFDSEGGGSEARDHLNTVLRALLGEGGKAKWKYLQKLVKVDKQEGITHLEFNSAVNYLVDNGVVEKRGSRPEREDDGDGSKLGDDTREVACTAKAWGWETGPVAYSDDKDSDLYIDGIPVEVQDGWKTRDYREIVVGGSTKKTHSIVLTERTSTVLDELGEMLNSLPDTDNMKPANINRSTIIEVALWTLYRKVSPQGRWDDEARAEPAMPKDQLQRLVFELIEKMNED